MNIFIIHGAHGNPEENWFPWLKTELEKRGHKVFTPKLPTPEGQFLGNWLLNFHKYRQHIDDNTIFVAHSLGPAFVISLLEEIEKKVQACFFVAPFIGLLRKPEFDNINRTFTQKSFNWNKIKTNCKNFFVYASDNDPHVDFRKSKEFAKKLGKNTRMFRIKGAGHFNTAAGYTKFDKLLKDILSVTN
jgi:serine hydrolase